MPERVEAIKEHEFGEVEKAIEVIDLGLRDYEEVYRIQLNLVSLLRDQKVSYEQLILVEHPAVYTYGRKSKVDWYHTDGTPQFWVERGGQATYHNPGQLVCYPILKLCGRERNIPYYLWRLEETTILCLKQFGISGERKPGHTGVWVAGKTRKIASIGVAISRWVTYHGVAINVENDLSGFLAIHPCGLEGSVITSMKKECPSVLFSMKEVKEAWVTSFLKVFERTAIYKGW